MTITIPPIRRTRLACGHLDQPGTFMRDDGLRQCPPCGGTWQRPAPAPAGWLLLRCDHTVEPDGPAGPAGAHWCSTCTAWRHDWSAVLLECWHYRPADAPTDRHGHARCPHCNCRRSDMTYTRRGSGTSRLDHIAPDDTWDAR